MELTAFGVDPAEGVVAWTGPWTATGFVQANNSAGESDFDFETDPSGTLATAAVTYADGTGSAAVPAVNGAYAEVAATISLPANIDESASVFPAQSSLENTFSIDDATGFVDVAFGALLESSLVADADAGGQVLQNDDIFNLDVDGTSVLSFFDQALAGPDGFDADTQNPNLNETISLDSSEEHDVVISLEYDPQALETIVPDAGPTWLLLVLGVGALAAAVSRIGWTRAAQARN